VYAGKNSKRRNRKETRITRTFHHPDFIYRDKWEGLIAMIIQVIRKTEIFSPKTKSWRRSAEIAYYISTKIFSAKETAGIIRGHWGIENRNHYVRDTALKEDASRIRKNAGIFVKLRSFALNIMRYNDVRNIADEIYKNSLSFERLKDYEGLLF
jgi:predicted transposase YbfD/YdcC